MSTESDFDSWQGAADHGHLGRHLRPPLHLPIAICCFAYGFGELIWDLSSVILRLR